MHAELASSAVRVLCPLKATPRHSRSPGTRGAAWLSLVGTWAGRHKKSGSRTAEG